MLAARFRRQGDRLLAAFGQSLDDSRRNRIGPQGRAGKSQALVADEGDQFVDVGIIGNGCPHEADLLAQLLAAQDGRLHIVQGADAGPAVTVAGHAEAAVTAAAPGNLDEVHGAELRIRRGDDRLGRLVQFMPLPFDLGRDAFFRDDAHDMAVIIVFVTVQRRHIDTGNVDGQIAQQFMTPQAPGLAFPIGIEEGMDEVFPFADQDDVDERRQRFGIEKGDGPAHDDERILIAAVSCQDGDTSHFQDLRHVEIIHFKTDR